MPKTTPREDAALKKIEQSNGPLYVSCDLSVAQKSELDGFIEGADRDAMLNWFLAKVGDNHTFSVRCNEVGYQCSLTGGKTHASHSNKCLISRSSTAERSMWSVMFKDTMVLKGIWPVSNRLEDLD